MKKNMLFILVFIPCYFYSGSIYAASITKKYKKKYVKINSGKNDGFEKGMEVCFFEEEKKITCGKIIKSWKKSSKVKVSKKKWKRLSLSMTAELKEAPEAKGPYRYAFRVNFLSMFVSPASYNDISYAISEAEESPWEIKSNRSAQIIGGGFDAEIGFSTSSSLGLGLRMMSYCNSDLGCTSSYDTDFSTTQPNLFARTEQSGSSTGFSLEYIYKFHLSNSSVFSLGSGVDFDSSSIQFKASQLDDNDSNVSNEIVSATSQADIISLKFVPQYNLFFAPIGISIGLPLWVPLSGNSSLSSEFAANSGESDTEKAEEDLKVALQHQKNSFAVALLLGLYAGF